MSLRKWLLRSALGLFLVNVGQSGRDRIVLFVEGTKMMNFTGKRKMFFFFWENGKRKLLVNEHYIVDST